MAFSKFYKTRVYIGAYIPPVDTDAWNNTNNIDLYFKTFVLED